MNETIRSILDRRSTRGFEKTPLADGELELLQQCALASPTAMNAQSWHFSFVTDQALLGDIERDVLEGFKRANDHVALERFAGRGNKVFYDAPLVVIVSGDRDSRWSDVDAGIAAQTLALAAHSMGLGSVIVGICLGAFDGVDGATLCKRVCFPDTHRFAIAIAIGKPTVTKDAHPIMDDRISLI